MPISTKRLNPSNQILLTICVIGRNEASNIGRLGAELAGIDLPFSIEFLYVDSASTDDSVQIATKHFNEVLVLEESTNLSASAGRHIGALLSSGKWILHLDADMRITTAFLTFLKSLDTKNTKTAWVGKYLFTDDATFDVVECNTWPNGNVDKAARRFGGAVLIPREALLDAGNWDPRLFANEEIELYGRLRHSGTKVHKLCFGIIVHPVIRVSNYRRIAQYFLPLGAKKKKFMGFGQIIASKSPRELFIFARYNPEPFVYWLGIALGVFALLASSVASAIVIASFTVAFTTVRRGFNFALSYFGLPIRVLLGCRKLDREYIPVIANHLSTSRVTPHTKAQN